MTTTGAGATASADPAPIRDRGRLVHIAAGDYEAEVSSVGAILESLTIGGRDLVLRSAEDGPMQFYRGAVVAPWPNRIGDGLYTWDGQEIQAPINEPERHNALHGLVCFHPFEVASAQADRAVLRTVLYPQPAYPFALELEVTHALDAATGLTTTVTARNVGRADAPFGVCPHPYVVAGPEPLDEWSLTTPAGTILDVTEDRLLPVGTVPTQTHPELDFRTARVIGDTFIDHAYTDLARDPDDLARITVTAPGGTGVEVTAGPACTWAQVHTGDQPVPEFDRKGLAVEPMTCPPDAFRTGQDVLRIAPGASASAWWSIRGW
jgi:aldose 1-epimerase